MSDRETEADGGSGRSCDWPKAVVWDLDGTLVDSAPDLAAALNQLLREQGLPGHGVAQVETMIGAGVAKLIERGFVAAGASIAPTTLDLLLPRFLTLYGAGATEETRLFPAAEAVLRRFAEAGVRQGLCTNKPRALSLQILAHFGLAELFAVVVGGDSTAARKPDPLPLRATLDGLRVTAADAVMVGDSRADLDMARALGLPVVLVSFGYSDTPAVELGADAVIESLSDLPDVLSRL